MRQRFLAWPASWRSALPFETPCGPRTRTPPLQSYGSSTSPPPNPASSPTQVTSASFLALVASQPPNSAKTPSTPLPLPDTYSVRIYTRRDSTASTSSGSSLDPATGHASSAAEASSPARALSLRPPPTGSTSTTQSTAPYSSGGSAPSGTVAHAATNHAMAASVATSLSTPTPAIAWPA